MKRKKKKISACHIAAEYRRPGAHCENIIEKYDIKFMGMISSFIFMISVVITPFSFLILLVNFFLSFAKLVFISKHQLD